jgi:hypothetical protein
VIIACSMLYFREGAESENQVNAVGSSDQVKCVSGSCERTYKLVDSARSRTSRSYNALSRADGRSA